MSDHQCGKPGRLRRGGGVAASLRSREGMGARHRGWAGLACRGDQYSCRPHGRASGALTIAFDALGPTYMQTGLAPGLMHRVAVIGAGTLDSLPHNGASSRCLPFVDRGTAKAIRDIVMTAIVGPNSLVAALDWGRERRGVTRSAHSGNNNHSHSLCFHASVPVIRIVLAVPVLQEKKLFRC
jgi:hypothetical protein